MKSVEQYVREERWVPVSESGKRWEGRTRNEALEAMSNYPAGGSFLDGEPWDGITHIEREVRFVSQWVVLTEEHP